MNDNKCGRSLGLRDFGGKPIAVNIDCAAKINPNYRTALWTGEHLQVTLMCIPVGEDIGAEVHCGTDQFLFVVSGKALAVTGPCRDNMHCRKKVECGCALIVPAGKKIKPKNTKRRHAASECLLFFRGKSLSTNNTENAA